MNTRIRFFALFLALLFSVSVFAACKKNTETEVKEIPKATFSSESKMFKREGLSIIMDANFEYGLSSDCTISASNGDLTFEAFYFEKYYFLEKDKSIQNPTDALSFVNKDKTVAKNDLGLPFVEYTKAGSDGVEYTFYYVCVADTERYWMCTFFAPTESFESYRAHIMDYLDTIEAVYEEEE